MKWVEEKEGSKTRIRRVPDDYKDSGIDIPQRDLTTGGACLISMDISKEEFKRIFKTQTNRENIAVQRENDKK